MQTEAQRQLHAEASNWLNTGRSLFIKRLLERYLAAPDGALDLLEVGAGAGQNLQSLSSYGSVDALEVSETAQEILRQRPEIRSLFTHPVPDASLPRRYDALLAADVLEHIEDDRAASQWMVEQLKPGGLLILTVPAYNWLFSGHDVANEHYRRYTVGQLKATLPPDVEVCSSGYFNMTLFPLALAARGVWSLKRGLRGSATSADGVVKKQSSQVPGLVGQVFGAILALESAGIARLGGLPYGLTAYCVGRKSPGGA